MRHVFAVLFFVASTASAADLPRYWTVHIDYAADRAEYQLQTKLAPISAATHKTLRKHHNKIWQIDRDLTNIRSDAAPKYMLLRTDDVRLVNVARGLAAPVSRA